MPKRKIEAPEQATGAGAPASATAAAAPAAPAPQSPQPALAAEPTWYKDAIIYELHIRAFADSNGDGIGDLPGLIDKLDYLHDLGVTALWLLPFYPSPLRDGGYDIADYEAVHPTYGTIADFKRLLREAHKRGLRVITELVLNHTSADHPWFQRARRAPAGHKHRDYYVWSDTPQKFSDTRIIFKDFETSNWSWDPVAGAYYWHRFYAHQPDLNFDNPQVVREVFKVVDFWLGLGVDGLRLDAVPYLFEREGTSCENLPETHEFLRQLRRHVDTHYADRMLLAEANQWPGDAAAYFGRGDECHMNFHFPLMPRMFMAVQLEDRFPIIDILRQTPAIHDSCQWATFLRNHDELTLEMVTDEDRDYMYRVFADEPSARINLGIRRRLGPLLAQRRKVELMNALLFALPGTPVLYYGDEIGMGDNIYLGDRDGVRTPMQWSADRNAGFSSGPSQRLYLPVVTDSEYHYEALNVQAQQQNPSSLLWWMKRLIALRKQHRVFGRGDLEFVSTANEKVLAFVRSFGEERVLVAANLSRFPQHAELDLDAARAAGSVPVEMFGRSRFPTVREGHAYPLSFGPHGFYWFLLEPEAAHAAITTHSLPHLPVGADGGVPRLLQTARAPLELALGRFLDARRWYRSKARKRRAVHVLESFALPPAHEGAPETHMLVLRVEFVDADFELYQIGAAIAATTEAAGALLERVPHAAIAELDGGALLYDALAVPETGDALLALLRRKQPLGNRSAELDPQPLPGFAELVPAEVARATAPQLEQSNSTFIFGQQLMMKVYRLLEEGVNAEVEMGRFLMRHMTRRAVPRLAASLELERQGRQPATAATLQEFVPNQGVAWQLAQDAISRCFERTLASVDAEAYAPARPPVGAMEQARAQLPPAATELVGGFAAFAMQLGRRTAELHLALATGKEPAFAPEPFTAMHQQSVYQRARSALVRTFELLRQRQRTLPEAIAAELPRVLELSPRIEARLRRITEVKLDAVRIRHHGDLHLGQVLFTGDDFVIIDFEGEPARPLHERRYKRGPLRDVAGMLRSFQYATATALRDGGLRPEDVPVLRPAARAWHEWVGALYLGAYVEATEGTPLLPRGDEKRNLLVDFYLLEKCIYEIGYELQNRPDWLDVPLGGLLELCEDAPG